MEKGRTGMKVLGIDPSTYTGMVQLDADEPHKSKLINFPTEKAFKRLQLIALSVNNTVMEWNPDIVVIEDYAIGNKFTRTEMVEIGTVIRMALFNLKLQWYTVPPSVLKKFVTSKGNATKPVMAVHVEEKWGFTSKYDDIIDAYGLAKMGQHITTLGITPEIKGVQLHGYQRIQKSSG
jgi:Holliday junction resolvasome RuvABC endonuclease subunit